MTTKERKKFRVNIWRKKNFQNLPDSPLNTKHTYNFVKFELW